MTTDADYVWTRTIGPHTRLYEDAERVYYVGRKACWDDMASPMTRMHVLRIVDGWSYARGPELDEAAQGRLDRAVEHAKSYPEFGDYYRIEIRDKVVPLIERLRKHPRPTRPLAELVAHLDDCMRAHAHIMGNLHWRMAAARLSAGGVLAPTFAWPPIYTEITGRPEAEAPVLVGGLANELTRTVKKLRKLAKLVQADADLAKVVSAGDIERIGDFAAFASGFRRLLRRYGHRTGAGWGASAWFGSPTWNVEPSIPLQMIATYSRCDLDEMDRKEREVLRDRKRLERDVRRELAKDPERLALFDLEFHRAKEMAFFLEDHNDWMDQSAPGVLRDAAHVVGLRLERDGVLDDPRDVVHLSLDELRDELRSLPSDVASLIAERKTEYERRKELDPPEVVGGEAMPPPVRHDEGEGLIGNELHGVKASSGRYTGRARVFMPSPMLPDVEDGDILVAVDAGPDWTPLFAILGAVVLDKGAAWQHAAVMAREFAIPAVTGTVSGTEAIVDGSTITVDGDAGVVLLAG